MLKDLELRHFRTVILAERPIVLCWSALALLVEFSLAGIYRRLSVRSTELDNVLHAPTDYGLHNTSHSIMLPSVNLPCSTDHTIDLLWTVRINVYYFSENNLFSCKSISASLFNSSFCKLNFLLQLTFPIAPK